jgi:Na+-transporting NADH:ubiquinone oxidoreductase subunit C
LYVTLGGDAVSKPAKGKGNSQTLFFMIVLAFVCALLLSIIASVLAPAQEKAEELDRAKQLLIAAQILNYSNTFQLPKKDGGYEPAYWDAEKKELVAKADASLVTPEEVFDVLKQKIRAYVVNEAGDLKTFEEANINESSYLSDNWKNGYASLSWKLVYQILPNSPITDSQENNEFAATGYIFPINGFGLWDAIYGYLAVSINADTVLGTTWYWQKETAGLGANISTPIWQAQFPGKLIFQESPNGTTDFKTAPLGLTVIRGKVKDILGDAPKGKSCLDGMSGATLTGNGVTAAYKDSLGPYRNFLLKLRSHWDERNGGNAS